MGQRTVRFSDFTSTELDNGNSVRIMLTYNEPGNTVAVVADAALDDDIVRTIEEYGKAQVRRGRKQTESRKAADEEE